MAELKERRKERIALDVEPNIKRDIKAEAARRGMTLTDYAMEILLEGHGRRKDK